jgi:oligogalacturonide lyase
MQTHKIIYFILLVTLSVLYSSPIFAQPVLETGGKKMPEEWIDRDTRHKVIRLSRKEGSNNSFYFHNDPFFGNKMVFYSTDKNGKQIYTVDLKTFAIDQITHQFSPMSGELVGQKNR